MHFRLAERQCFSVNHAFTVNKEDYVVDPTLHKRFHKRRAELLEASPVPVLEHVVVQHTTILSISETGLMDTKHPELHTSNGQAHRPGVYFATSSTALVGYARGVTLMLLV